MESLVYTEVEEMQRHLLVGLRWFSIRELSVATESLLRLAEMVHMMMAETASAEQVRYLRQAHGWKVALQFCQKKFPLPEKHMFLQLI